MSLTIPTLLPVGTVVRLVRADCGGATLGPIGHLGVVIDCSGISGRLDWPYEIEWNIGLTIGGRRTNDSHKTRWYCEAATIAPALHLGFDFIPEAF